MFSAKQGRYWYHFDNVFGMTRSFDWGLNPRPPALEASTIPLGLISVNRGGASLCSEYMLLYKQQQLIHWFFSIANKLKLV